MTRSPLSRQQAGDMWLQTCSGMGKGSAQGSNTVLVVEKLMPNQSEDSADAGKLF